MSNRSRELVTTIHPCRHNIFHNSKIVSKSWSIMSHNQVEPVNDLPLLWLVIHSPRVGYLVHMFTLRSPKKALLWLCILSKIHLPLFDFNLDFFNEDTMAFFDSDLLWPNFSQHLWHMDMWIWSLHICTFKSFGRLDPLRLASPTGLLYSQLSAWLTSLLSQ